MKSGGNTLQTVNKTLGLYAQEEAAYRDRMFLTFAERTDQNSSFGTKFQRVVYPKAQVSWILSDESFFPHPEWLNQFRLRSAFGASGVQPGGTVALQTFSVVDGEHRGGAGIDHARRTRRACSRTPSATRTSSRSARPSGRAASSRTCCSNRVHLDVTYYTRKTKDAIISEPIAASSGASALSVLKNLGSVQNTGLEFGANATVIDRRAHRLGHQPLGVAQQQQDL